MNTAYFNHFDLELPDHAVKDCSHSGQCGEDVAYWTEWIVRPDDCTPAVLAAELKEHGAWTAEELADDAANWRRIIWLAACNIREEQRSVGTEDVNP